MKKIIKRLSLLVLIILSLVFIYPKNIWAISEQTSYISINMSQEDIIVGDLSFYDISFKDYSLTSNQAFGLSGMVNNNSKEKINCIITVYYYDKNYNLIAQSLDRQIVLEGINNFNQMSNLSILHGHSLSEIYYYRLVINTKDSIPFKEEDEFLTTPSKNYKYSSYDYVIDKYDVNILVNENNTLDITETITAYFNIPMSGITQIIPLTNSVKKLDGTMDTNLTQVTNVQVNKEYTTSIENEKYKIIIGNSKSMFEGEETFVIKYTYNLGKDRIKDYDILSFNIIVNEWKTLIGNITFKITMPKAFLASKLTFASGINGTTNDNHIKYNVNGLEITGSYDGILKEYQALKLRCELNNNYFVDARLNSSSGDYVMLFVLLIFLGIAFGLWYKYGHDEILTETVEFYPPDGLNSLEAGFIYKGEAKSKDVISLLIYLANQGYIKIEEFRNKTGFYLIKLRDYSGNDVNEELFLKGLFKSKNKVTLTNLENRFYKVKDKILKNINDKKNKEKIFITKNTGISLFIVALMIIAYSLITIPKFMLYKGDFFLLFLGLLVPEISLILVFNLKIPEKYSAKLKLLSVLYSFNGIFAWFTLMPSLLLQIPNYLLIYLVGIICIIGMSVILKFLPKRTPYGLEMLAKLRGFKNFLETVELEKLERMVDEKPTYFYDILPYAYVLDVSDKWIKNFETIVTEAPDWYNDTNSFTMENFEKFITNAMTEANRAMISNYSENIDIDIRSSSSRGGSAGGGSGGGGGGSW